MGAVSRVLPIDDPLLEVALTRFEVMRARGYGDDSNDHIDRMAVPTSLVVISEQKRRASSAPT
jgi:hypothetical protein